VPESLSRGLHDLAYADCALLFPDIVFRPRRALGDIIDRHRSSDSDVVIALVPAESGEKVDIVSVSDDGLVEGVVAKPGPKVRGLTWIAAVWGPRFSNFLHEKLSQSSPTLGKAVQREIYVGDVLNAGISEGLTVNSIAYPSGDAYDLGTRDELEKFWRESRS
jgi:glucose-1-phosphate thymidylyltransferase